VNIILQLLTLICEHKRVTDKPPHPSTWLLYAKFPACACASVINNYTVQFFKDAVFNITCIFAAACCDEAAFAAAARARCLAKSARRAASASDASASAHARLACACWSNSLDAFTAADLTAACMGICEHEATKKREVKARRNKITQEGNKRTF